MINKHELNFFKRYLKEKKLYFSFRRDCNLSHHIDGKRMLLSDAIRKKTGYGATTTLIMDCVYWAASKYHYWGEIYRDYTNYFQKNYYGQYYQKNH